MIETAEDRRPAAPSQSGTTQRTGRRRLPGVDLRPGAVKQARKQSGLSLFTYYDVSGAVLTTPIANQHIITSIGVNLAEPLSHSSSGRQLNVVVSLRNRKVNL